MMTSKRLARRADRLGEQALFLIKLAVAQKLRHADDAVHRGANLVAHVGEEGRFGPVGSLGRLARGQKVGLLLLGMGDIDPQANAATIRRGVVLRTYPAPIAEALLGRDTGVAVLVHAVVKPFLLAPDGIGVLAMGQAIAQDILETWRRAAWPGPQANRCHGSVDCRSKADPPCRKAQIHPE